ncbi:MAG TPA: YbdK family carboxylate-amine ligase [Candidatus Agrococcus pullicola]|uniref:Putative glutamate--cysteine ligase 2 n=1 Tax=Candidatus Agrococcus pullicola TaxID=2838429 RepID=A0A9D1YX54_9MICO|nr:YbdK family carboxylate-amine ligase [Candidatus Agrococcus pullicola]
MKFKQCAAGTVGIEWELQVVDPQSRDLVSRAPDLIKSIDDSRIQGEFFNSTVELISGIHPSVDSAMREMRELRDIVMHEADTQGLAIVGMGVHPFSHWQHQTLADSDRYRRVVDRVGEWGKRQIMIGVHTHFAVGDGDAAVAIQNRLLAELPLILALSASSPFRHGRDTGVASQRSMIFQQLPNAGLPPLLDSWDAYTELVRKMRRIDAIEEPGELRWAVRPAPVFGTIEARIADGAPSLVDLAAVNALTVLSIERIARELREGDVGPMTPDWLLRENRWRAIRYGLDAEIAFASGATRPVVELLHEAIRDLAPLADELGAKDSLEQVGTVLRRGNSAQRQRAVDRIGSVAVVDHLVADFRS